MIEQRIHCDRCGNTILDGGRTKLVVECGPLRKRQEHSDLCVDCLPLLEGWLAEARPASHRITTPEPAHAG